MWLLEGGLRTQKGVVAGYSSGISSVAGEVPLETQLHTIETAKRNSPPSSEEENISPSKGRKKDIGDRLL